MQQIEPSSTQQTGREDRDHGVSIEDKTLFAPSEYRGPLGLWYWLTVPPEPPSTAPIWRRERFRRSRIASVILLIYFVLLALALPLGLQSPPTLSSLLVGMAIAVVGIILNRVGQVYVAGVLLTIYFIASIVGVLLSCPNQMIDIDYLRLYYMLVIAELFAAALKYSAPGTPIRVASHVNGVSDSAVGEHGSAPSEAQAFVELTVQDFGLGIPPDQIPLLFRRFVRLQRDLASRTLGTGLGLYLCRVYVEVMGGTIWVESTGIEGEGSTFHLRLPLAPHSATVELSEQSQLEAAVLGGVND
jgi:K+-sensing histidine kinase KdpD